MTTKTTQPGRGHLSRVYRNESRALVDALLEQPAIAQADRAIEVLRLEQTKLVPAMETDLLSDLSADIADELLTSGHLADDAADQVADATARIASRANAVTVAQRVANVLHTQRDNAVTEHANAIRAALDKKLAAVVAEAAAAELTADDAKLDAGTAAIYGQTARFETVTSLGNRYDDIRTGQRRLDKDLASTVAAHPQYELAMRLSNWSDIVPDIGAALAGDWKDADNAPQPRPRIPSSATAGGILELLWVLEADPAVWVPTPTKLVATADALEDARQTAIKAARDANWRLAAAPVEYVSSRQVAGNS